MQFINDFIKKLKFKMNALSTGTVWQFFYSEKTLYGFIYMLIIFYFFYPVIFNWTKFGFIFLYVTLCNFFSFSNFYFGSIDFGPFLWLIFSCLYLLFVFLVSGGGLLAMFLFFRWWSGYLLTKDPWGNYKKKYGIRSIKWIFIFLLLLFWIESFHSSEVFAAENNSIPNGDPFEAGISFFGNICGLLFGLLFFTVIEIIQFRREEKKSLLGLGSSNIDYSLRLESMDNTYSFTLQTWSYRSLDSNLWLDWLALHWPTIQHSVSIVGGCLVFYYFKKDCVYYLNSLSRNEKI